MLAFIGVSMVAYAITFAGGALVLAVSVVPLNIGRCHRGIIIEVLEPQSESPREYRVRSDDTNCRYLVRDFLGILSKRAGARMVILEHPWFDFCTPLSGAWSDAFVYDSKRRAMLKALRQWQSEGHKT
ncbi:MAG: hypothetical protein ABL901_06585 [Hyphomicrobiaceae bacterium]